MVDYVMQRGADVIVVQFLDRLGRNPREIPQRYWQLQDVKVSVVATDEDYQEELILLISAGNLAFGKRPKMGNPRQELVRVEGFFPAILSDRFGRIFRGWRWDSKRPNSRRS